MNMAKVGRKKKLTALHHLENSRQKISRLIGIDGYGTPLTFNHLHADAKQCIEIIEHSMPPNIYTRLDSFMLAVFATAWAGHKHAVEEMSKPDFEPVVTNDKGNVSPSPWYKILNSQAQVVVAVGGRLGLDPLTRQDLKSPEQRNQSKFAGLIGLEAIEPDVSSHS